MLINEPNFEIDLEKLKRIAQSTNATIEPTIDEKAVFDIIKGAAEAAPEIIMEINAERAAKRLELPQEEPIPEDLMDIPEQNAAIAVRAAGGWTRDKLLGIPSNDIDLMVETLRGEDFAKIMVNFLRKTTVDPELKDMIRNSVDIKENPEKTKNIGTATVKIPFRDQEGNIVSQELDFAQARSEEYADPNSRNPIVKPATAVEDAFRRDLTINSMFYNINEDTVEDFTGQGLKDLNVGGQPTIRTPLDPYKTFSEDPLRIFRAIRFAAKYNGEIDEKLLSAISNLDEPLKDHNGRTILDENNEPLTIQKQLDKKVAKERIGQEFMKTLKNPNSDYAVKLMKETGVWDDIVNKSLAGTEFEGELEPWEMDQRNPHHELSVWGHTFEVFVNSLQQFAGDEDEKRAIAALVALFHDIGKLYRDVHKPRMTGKKNEEKPKMFTDPSTGEEKQVVSYGGHEDASALIAPHVMKYLKLTNNTIKEVVKLVRNHMKLHEMTRVKTSDEKIRKLLRELLEQGVQYTDLFKFTLADAHAKKVGGVGAEVIEKYEALNNRLEGAMAEMGSKEEILTPIISGNEIIEIFKDREGNRKKAGPWVGEVMNFVKTLKDKNPNITRDEAIESVKARFSEMLPKPVLSGNDFIQIFNKPAGPWIKDVKSFVETLDPMISKEDAIQAVKVQFSDLLNEIREASAKEKKELGVVCPKHLLEKIKKDIKEALGNKNDYLASSIMRKSIDEYGDDEDLVRFIAQVEYLLICKDLENADGKIMQHVFTKAEHNTFDSKLRAFVFGILLIVDTPTEDNPISDMGRSVLKLNASLLKEVMDNMPEKVKRQKIKNDFCNKVKNK